MAIFASTTTSGYSDPIKALTIKALEKRQADMMAQQASQQPDTALMSTIPGGIGHVLGVVGDQMKQARTDAALASRRDELTKVMSGIDWDKGPNAQQIAGLGSADPETMRQVLTTMAENRRAAQSNETTQRGQDLTATGVREGHGIQREGQQITKGLGEEGHNIQRAGQQLQLDLADKAALNRREEALAERDFKGAQAALERAHATGDTQLKIDAQAKLAETQNRLDMVRDKATQDARAALPASDQGKIAADANKGLITPEERASAMTSPVKPAAVKALSEAKSSYTTHAQEIGNLERARGLLEKGINTGTYGAAATGIANATNGYLGDKDKAQRTTDFNNIINAETIKRMSETLKGASTDFEMKKFIEVYNNPNASEDARKLVLENLITKAKIDKETHAGAIKQFGGDTKEIDTQLGQTGGPNAAAAKSPADTEALDWATKNPDDPRAIKIKQRLGVK